MGFELDHVFVCCDLGAPEADLLVRFGLTEGGSNQHPGQGTANRRFFFLNAMLELLWVCDAGEAGSEVVRPTRLLDRWRERAGGCSPFGLALRPTDGSEQKLPFPAWEYRPAYLPDSLAIHMGENSRNSAEPLLFYLSFAGRQDPAGGREPANHGAGFREITGVRITSPHAPLSPTARAVMRLGIAVFQSGDEPLLELEFDGAEAAERADFRPHLPLVFGW